VGERFVEVFGRLLPVESAPEGLHSVADAPPRGITSLPDDVSAPSQTAVAVAVAAVAKAVRQRDQTIAVVEGATGGYLAHVLTMVPGASAWFRAGIVAYTDYPKQLLLRVSTDTIEARGSITAETTIQMARLARRLFGTDWAVALTGYADDTAPKPSVRAPGAPGDVPAGYALVQGEIRHPIAGATIVAIAGAAGTGDQTADDTDISWQEHLVPARDRDGYRRGAALVALEYLLEHITSDDHQ
jgi:nicotinamide mononucleotide (NMN) deamidase PncC